MNIPKVLSGNAIEGKKVTVSLCGRKYTRVFRYRRDCGLYIIINNTEYYLSEMEF